jgi:hypothetical protein
MNVSEQFEKKYEKKIGKNLKCERPRKRATSEWSDKGTAEGRAQTHGGLGEGGKSVGVRGLGKAGMIGEERKGLKN